MKVAKLTLISLVADFYNFIWTGILDGPQSPNGVEMTAEASYIALRDYNFISRSFT